MNPKTGEGFWEVKYRCINEIGNPATVTIETPSLSKNEAIKRAIATARSSGRTNIVIIYAEQSNS